MKKTSLILLPALLVAFVSAQAQSTAPMAAPAASAPEPAPAPPFTGNINLTTNYKFRGQDQGDGKYFSPAVQGGFDYTVNGFYLGNWNSNVSFSGGNIEMDFYGGYKGEIIKDVGYDVGALQYYYPKASGTNYNTTEIYGAVTYSFFSLKYSHTVSRDYFGDGENLQVLGTLASRPRGRNTGYLDLSGNYEFIKGWTFNGHLGYTRLSNELRTANVGAVQPLHDGSYLDWKAGATYDLGNGFAAAAAFIGANKRSTYGDINKTRAVLTISKSM